MSDFQKWVEMWQKDNEIEASDLSSNAFGTIVWDYKQEQIQALQKENEELKRKLDLAVETVEYYGKEEHWDDRIFLEAGDTESTKTSDYCGGKRARQALKEIKEMK